MKFCYIDESGTGGEPISVMVGIITDHNRMRPTKADWKGLLGRVSDIVGKIVKEIHTHQLYAGNSPFRQLTPQQRIDLIVEIFKWLKDRKHSVVYTALDTFAFKDNCPRYGRKLDEISLPVSQVTSCVFGGANFSDLFITTASVGLSKEEILTQPHAGSLFMARNVCNGGKPASRWQSERS